MPDIVITAHKHVSVSVVGINKTRGVLLAMSVAKLCTSADLVCCL